jgi:hypothetical protein
MTIMDRRTAIAREIARHRWWLPPTALWVLLYSWRPWRFGFYHDDWSLTLPRGPSGSILAQLYDTDTSRPMAVLVRWFIHELVGQSPFGWQVSAVAAALAGALTLALLLRSVLRSMQYDELSAGTASGLAVASYLAFPWLLGTAWATGSMYHWTTIGINSAYLTWFAPWPLWRRCVLTAICFAAASLITETYWLSFAPFAVLVALCCRTLSRRDLAYLAGTLTVLQLGLIAFNRLIAMWRFGANKSFDPNWLSTLVAGNRHEFVIGMDHIFGHAGVIALAVLSGALLAAAIASWGRRRACALLMPAVAGMALSLLLFAAAGYAIQLTGLFARTTVGASWWLAIALAPAIAAIRQLPRPIATLAIGAWVLMTVMLARGTLVESDDWIAAWRQQTEILARIPRPALLAAPTNSVLVMEAPKQIGEVGTFHAPWDISSAIWVVAPDVARHLTGSHVVGSPFAIPVPDDNYWGLRATRTDVTQTRCANPKAVPIFNMKGATVLIWNVSDGAVETVSDPVELGCPATSANAGH